MGYIIVGISLFVFVQAENVYPQLLIARLFFSIGGAATATMVTAVLPAMTAPDQDDQTHKPLHGQERTNGHMGSPSLSSELTVTPARFSYQYPPQASKPGSVRKNASPTRLAGLVGMFTGCGALIALGVFLPLPQRIHKLGVSLEQALKDSYYVVGAIAFLVALACLLGLRRLNGEDGKTWRRTFGSTEEEHTHLDGDGPLPYHVAFLTSLRLGLQNQLIGLGYLGGFVARASSVGISLFIPLYINNYFRESGTCKNEDLDHVKTECLKGYILAAKLTGTSQLVALLFAPVFGYLADRYRRFHIPLLAAAVSGIAGYLGFAGLKSPETNGENGSPFVYAIVALLGISQSGCIVCSLGLLGRGILGLDDEQGITPAEDPSNNISGTDPSSPHLTSDRVNLSCTTAQDPREDRVERVDEDHERAGLLGDRALKDSSRHHLKGSVAGIYSLAGGAGILLLTKLGGFLFDVQSPAAPFYMLSLFNLSLLIVGVLCIVFEVLRARAGLASMEA